MKRKAVTVFGSALPKEGHEEFETAYKLGALLAKNNFDVCTGGFQGIMNAISKGASENGTDAIGVTVDLWGSVPSSYLTREVKCNTLFERVTNLIECGDAYIVLQGGTGTLLEFATVWEMINKKMMAVKPVVCYSVMWKDIISIINKQLENENRPTGIVKHFDNIEDIVEHINKELTK